jgi:hypothetical protein
MTVIGAVLELWELLDKDVLQPSFDHMKVFTIKLKMLLLLTSN